MRNYVFDEQKSIEQIINNGIVDNNNLVYTIKDLARYNHYVRGLNKKDNYGSIDEYMRAHSSIYTEVGYSQAINGCIKDVVKKPFCNIQSVVITQEELETIKKLNDDRKEKLAFVLLADAKYFDQINGKKTDISWISVRDLYQLARVTMPIGDRAMFLGFLYEDELVKCNYNPKFTGHTLLYVSNTNDDVGLVLTENNYKELAFTYMNWKYGGYKECEKCGRLIKVRKNTKYCKDCAPSSDTQHAKMVVCVDCGTEFAASINATNACRCSDCREAHKREYWKIKKREYRQQDVSTHPQD